MRKSILTLPSPRRSPPRRSPPRNADAVADSPATWASSATTGSAASPRPLEAGDPGRLRLRARERLLPRQLELERQRASLHRRREHRDGLLRRLEEDASATSASTSARSTTTTRAPRRSAGDARRQLGGYIGGSWKWLTVKYSYAFSDYFGLAGLTTARATSTCGSRPSDGPRPSVTAARRAHYGMHDGQELRRAGLQRLEARRHL